MDSKQPRFRRSDVPEEGLKLAKEEENDWRKTRFNSKTKVLELTTEVLTDYKNDLSNENKVRKSFAVAVFWIISIWLILLILILVFAGSEVLKLGSGVLIALITGATVSLIGLLGTVISYFFTKSAEQIALYSELFKVMLENEESNN